MTRKKKKLFNFHEVTICVSAVSAEDAYDQLCNMLRSSADFTTRTYAQLDENGCTNTRGWRSTSELYPRPRSPRELDK